MDRSTVARLVGATPYRTGRHATGVIFTYWSDTGFDAYHWYYNTGVSAGVIPTNDGHTCIFASLPQSRFQETMRRGTDAGYRQVLQECGSDLAATVERSKQVEKYRGFSGEIGFFRQSFGPGWALVGDAGYFKDPLTAHGITDAFIDAELLAQAAAAGTETAFAGYQSARDTLAVAHFDVTDAVASFEWDLPKVQQLHRALSEEMKKESLAVTNFAPCRRSQIPGKVIDDLTRVVFGTMDERRLPSSKDRQPKRIQAWRIDDASLVPQVSFVINHRHVQPAVIRSESRRPHDRTELSVPQIELPP